MVVVLVRLPEAPVTVTVTVPVFAMLLAVKVSVLEVVVLLVLAGLNTAVTPAGRPEADKFTLLLKPFCGVTVMVLAPLAPCVMVRLFGDAERVNVGGAFTVSEIVVVLDRLLDVPVTVTMTVPVAAVLLAVKVNVLEVVVLLVLAGLNTAVTPAGNPEADKLTLALKPFCGVTVMVLVPLAPCRIVKLAGDAESAKFPCGLTVREIVVLLVKLPDEPVTVTVMVPTVAAPLADRVRRLVEVAGFAPKVAVIPLGKAEAVKFTVPLNPFRGLMVIVVEPEAPWRMVKLAGDAERRKFGCVEDAGQLLTKLAALTVPMPVAKSHPVFVLYAGAKDVLDVESTPTEPPPR
jgi:hypothetical protein